MAVALHRHAPFAGVIVGNSVIEAAHALPEKWQLPAHIIGFAIALGGFILKNSLDVDRKGASDRETIADLKARLEALERGPGKAAP